MNEPLEKDRLHRISEAEKIVMTAGFNFIRVRDHGPIARLELLPDDILRFVNCPNRHEIVRQLKSIGYKYVTIDASGYVMGSMLK